MKGITPIISIIVLLLIVVAMGAVAYTYLYGYYTTTTANTISKQPGSEFENTVIIRNMGTEPLLTSKLNVTVEAQPAQLIDPPASIPAGRTAVLTFDSPVYGNNLLVRIVGPNNVISYRVSIPMPEGFMIWLTEPDPDTQNNTFTANNYIFMNATANQVLTDCVVYANGVPSFADGIEGPYCWKTLTGLSEGAVYFYMEGNNDTEVAETEHMQITIDQSPPILSFVSPTPPDGYASENLYFEVNVSADENLEECKLEHNRDGSYENQSMTEYGSYCYWNLTGLAADTTVAYRVYGSDFVDPDPHWGVTEFRNYNALSSGGNCPDPPDVYWQPPTPDNGTHGTRDYLPTSVWVGAVIEYCYFEHNQSGGFENYTNTTIYGAMCNYNLTDLPVDHDTTIYYRMHVKTANDPPCYNDTEDRTYTVDQSEFSFSSSQITIDDVTFCDVQTPLDGSIEFRGVTDRTFDPCCPPPEDYGGVFEWGLPSTILPQSVVTSAVLEINNTGYYPGAMFPEPYYCQNMNTAYFYRADNATDCSRFNALSQNGVEAPPGYPTNGSGPANATADAVPAFEGSTECVDQTGVRTFSITGTQADALIRKGRLSDTQYFDMHNEDANKNVWLLWGGDANPDSVAPALEINWTRPSYLCEPPGAGGLCEFGEPCSSDCGSEVYCNDMVDNDQDGQTDCQEGSCAYQQCDFYNSSIVCQGGECLPPPGPP